MKRLVGLETEYGIAIQDRDVYDLVSETAELVARFPGPNVQGWDYRFENPRRDARGFEVERLRVDPVDAQFDRAGSPPADTVRVDRVLSNGARLYNDHGHPEYSTPECVSLTELVAQDWAGMMVVRSCAEAYRIATGREVSLYKNNTDYSGASYGTHENYLALRSVPFERYASALLAFLPTRIVFAGAGRVGRANSGEPRFQLSQRADSFGEPLGVDTLYRRPLVNTRDEPHADPARWRRIHVIAGDANMQQFATALKVGTTSLVLDLVETGWECPFQLRDPVRAMAEISRDETQRWNVELVDGRVKSALDVQWQFCQEASKRFEGRDAQTDWVLAEWGRTLSLLAEDPLSVADRLDWPAKWQLLRLLEEELGDDWGSDRMLAADLEYHNLDPEKGLYWALPSLQLVTEERCVRAITEPPSDTRASIRGIGVKRYRDRVTEVSWSGFTLSDGGRRFRIDLSGAVGELDSEAVAAAAAALCPEAFKERVSWCIGTQ